MKLSMVDVAVLKSLGVKALVLFGSQAQGFANEASDYDFFVIARKNIQTYNTIYDILAAKINKLVDIDIVFEEDAPGELKAHVAKYGIPLYEKEGNVFADFKQKTMLEYSDFAPLRAIFSNATIARIGL